MTPKQSVLTLRPFSYSDELEDGKWAIYEPREFQHTACIGQGDTAAKAWADAERRIRNAAIYANTVNNATD